MSNEAEKAWNSDVVSIGKVLRSHLYVEYYLNKYIFDKQIVTEQELDNLTFAEKVRKIPDNDALSPLSLSIKHLNWIRNRMSHNLGECVNKKDSDYFFENTPHFEFYCSLYPNVNKPVDIYELHSRFVAQRISETLNPKQDLINNVIQKALKQDVNDIYNG
jgi:hypothetical protein